MYVWFVYRQYIKLVCPIIFTLKFILFLSRAYSLRILFLFWISILHLCNCLNKASLHTLCSSQGFYQFRVLCFTYNCLYSFQHWWYVLFFIMSSCIVLFAYLLLLLLSCWVRSLSEISFKSLSSAIYWFHSYFSYTYISIILLAILTLYVFLLFLVASIFYRHYFWFYSFIHYLFVILTLFFSVPISFVQYLGTVSLVTCNYIILSHCSSVVDWLIWIICFNFLPVLLSSFVKYYL